MTQIEDIIGKEEAEELRNEAQDALLSGAGYDEIEDIMLGYGLEMDYIDQVLFI